MNDVDRQTFKAVAGALYFAADRIADLVEREDQKPSPTEFMAWAAEGRERLTAMGEVGSRAHSIIAHSRIYDGRTIPALNHHEQALKALQQEPPLSLPSQFLAELEAEEGEQGE